MTSAVEHKGEEPSGTNLAGQSAAQIVSRGQLLLRETGTAPAARCFTFMHTNPGALHQSREFFHAIHTGVLG